MKTKVTLTTWRYILGVLFFVAMGHTVSAQVPSVTIVPSGPIVCSGTKLDAVVANLNPPLTYLWSTGATTSSINITQTGFYRVRVTGLDSSGNQVTIRSSWYPFLVIPTTNASIAPAGPITLCPGQSQTLTANGGQFFSSYLWNTGQTSRNITVNQSGDYTVTVTNNFGSCSTSTSATVHVEVIDSGFVPVITPDGPVTVCKPGYVNLSADSGYSNYTWSTGDTTQDISVLMDGLQQGAVLDTLTVSLTVTVNNTCSFTSDEIVLRSVRMPQIMPDFCDNWTLTLADSIRCGLVLTYLSAPSYEFEFEETTNPGTVWTYVSSSRWARLADVSPALEENKFYNVRARAIIDGTPYCYGAVCQIGIVGTNMINNQSVTQSLRMDGTAIETSVFPNPSAESFNIIVRNIDTDIPAVVTISDLSGRLIETAQYDATTSSMNFGNNLTNGVYLVTVEQGSAKSITRIVKSN